MIQWTTPFEMLYNSLFVDILVEYWEQIGRDFIDWANVQFRKHLASLIVVKCSYVEHFKQLFIYVLSMCYISFVTYTL